MTVLDQEPRRLDTPIGEAGEVALATESRDRGDLVWEVADVLSHLAVVMAANEVAVAEAIAELAPRAGGAGR